VPEVKSYDWQREAFSKPTLTAAELRKLPRAQRAAILEAAAQLAEHDYRHDAELTAFEAFGRDDLYGDSAAPR
jgi:hypothetical protein